jgi:hypothetical protein
MWQMAMQSFLTKNGNSKLTNNHNQITTYDKLVFNDTIYDKRKSLTQ